MVPTSHVVAMPYPGRGHINPMMNLCKSIVSSSDKILITFVVTEEWLGLMGSDSVADRIQFRCIPNVLPSELDRAKDMPDFIEAVSTKMEPEFEKLLHKLEFQATLIMADALLSWPVRVANRIKIPVALLWNMSAMTFSIFRHFDLFEKKGHFPAVYSENGDERVEYIPGVSSIRIVDLPPLIKGTRQRILNRFVEAFSWHPKAQYLLFATFDELESTTIQALKHEIRLPIYTIGPAIPYHDLGGIDISVEYLKWLDRQPSRSVLYISLGSYLSVSSEQIDEILAGLLAKGVPFMWVARGQCDRLKKMCGDLGLIVPWCNQLRVLCHPSIGGFLTHCGWNSVLEGIFAGVAFLTFPIGADQYTNSKLIVDDLKIGWRVKDKLKVESLVTRDEIGRLVKDFLDLKSNERKAMQMRVKEMQRMCESAISRDGSSNINISSFIRDISP